jgi:type I restriction enzyme S subunit
MLLLQYFDELTLQPQNAKKLKGLILELAVRGKLTKKWRIENPNTESATELLTQIKAEKKRLIAAKEIRKEKPLPKIEAEEIPFNLPENWIWCRLRDLTKIITKGASPKWQGISYVSEGILFITSENIGNYKLRLEKRKYVEQKFNEIQKRSILEKNDILMNIVGASIGRTAIFDLDEVANINQAVTIIRLVDKSNFEYYLRFFNSPICISYMFDKQVDNARANLSMSNIAKFLIPLPPLSEQKAIVKIVEQLFEEVEVLERLTEERLVIKQNYITAILNRLANENTEATWQQLLPQFEQFFDTEKSIKALRQTILQLAVQGKLTKDWRKANPNTSSATELLQQIKTEKKRLIAEKVIKKEKVLPKITKEEIPFELPENWVWCRLGNIAQFINGDRGKNYPNKSEYVEKGIPWINTGHIKPNGTLSTTKMNYITKEKFDILRGGKIKDGDLVYCLRGATFGKTAFVTPYNIGAIASSLMIIRLYFLDLGQFTYRFLISNEGRKQLLRFDNGSAQPNLSANKVKLYLYPLPPLSEQKAIVEKVATLLGCCDALEAAIAERGKRVEALMDGSLSGILGV